MSKIFKFQKTKKTVCIVVIYVSMIKDKTWNEEVKKLQEEIDGEGLKYDNTIIYGMTNNTREETKDRNVFHNITYRIRFFSPILI